MSRPLHRWTVTRAAAWLSRFGARVFHAAERTIDPAEIVRLIHDEPPAAIDDWLSLAPEPVELSADAALARIAERFELTATEAALVALIAAPALRVELARLYRFLLADDRPLTAGFVAELVSDTPMGFDAAMACLHPSRALVRHGLVVMGAGQGQGSTVQLSADLLDALAGVEPVVVGERPAPDPQPWPHQATLLDALAARPTRVHLLGSPGSGRLAALTAAIERPPLCLDVASGRVDLPGLDRAARVARLRSTWLCLRIDEPLEDAELAALRAWLPGRRCVIATAPDVDLPPPDRAVTAPRLSVAEQAACWRRALGAGWAADLPERLAERFDRGPGRIAEAAAGCPTDEAALLARLRARPPHRLDRIAERTTSRMTWADVVLPDEVEAGLRDIVACARSRRQVLDEWGFDRLLPYGRGLGCLFAGPPGTGKTMMAGILANALGLELYRVDVSRLVSKWLGETEKNLSRLFAEAAKARAILFFDEADSLFARRTGVKSSNDRHANMEVNHLLQKMERYDGISILATNLEGSIDEAFKRRLRFVVHFEAPDASARARLWQAMIPAAAPLAEGVRFDRLGRQFKLSGGHIKNAVVRAAWLAADRRQSIDEALLSQAATAELRAIGRL